MDLETHIPGAPSAFAAAASFLRERMSTGESALADDVIRQRAILRDGWEGKAGAAFKVRATGLAGAADEAARLADSASTEIDALGHALASAQSQMASLLARARDAGLPVEATVIKPPAPMYIGGGEFVGLAELERLTRVWNELVIEHEAVMTAWYQALDASAAFIKGHAADLIGVTTELMVAGYSAALLSKGSKVMAAQSIVMRKQASVLAAHADALLESIRAGKFLDQLDHYDDLVRGSREASSAADVAGRNAKNPHLPGGLKGGLGALGAITTGYGIYSDIASGESGEQAFVSQGGGLLAGAVAGGLVGGAIGSAGFPVVGTVVGGIVGAGAGMFADSQIDEAYEDGRPAADGPLHASGPGDSGAAILGLMMDVTSGEPGDHGQPPGLLDEGLRDHSPKRSDP